MCSSQRSNDVCQTCRSTDGELISLFPGNYEAARLTKKIRTISSFLVEKSDIKQMCKRCIYLAESVFVMKRYLASAESTSRQIWEKARNEEGAEAQNPTHPNKDFVENEIPVNPNENVVNTETLAQPNEDIVEAEIPAHPNNDSEAEIPAHQNKDIEAEIPAHPEEETEHDELSYNIEWISEEERIKAVNAFRRKWEKEREKKLEEASKIIHEVETVEESLPLIDIESPIMKTETPDESTENHNKPEENGDSMEKESPMSENHNTQVKTEYIETEEVDNAIQSDKTDDDKMGEVTEKKEDSKVIVISDSDEDDSSDLHRQPLSTIPSNSSGVIGNSNSSLNSQRGTKRISRDKVSASGKNASAFERKEKTTDGREKSSRIIPRKFFQCTRCNVNLYTVAAVLVHHNQVHTPNKASLSCRMCDKTFPAKSDLFAHFNQHVESHLFRCPHCRSEFVLKQNLMVHMKTHKKRASLSEPKSPNKRFRNNSEHSVLSTDAPGNSEKENIVANMQIADAQDLDNNVGREYGPRDENGITANLPNSVAESTDTNLVEQEEEDRGNENGTTGNSVTPVVQS